ncbi:GGDEF domain-containing response regulator [Thioflexithrix psekupsensis]|uniref:Histidine kinase n=1 Tax=Thioflexithrix psekupsensis TaxID=1570016 RepID=A0A251X4M7_9GAMM|nr:GGDEF domain-containing response regulator [Thioflexithrix psekupsensis]OUD12149.1 hypothetical protein TPSD3_13560 [Thioflexithrix psekupsensis]
MTNSIRPLILVVDDAPLMRGILESVLRKYGYEVETAQNGLQAIDFVLEFSPDLILMDADMPVLGGVEACAQIRSLPNAENLPIVIVTSFTESEWIDRAYAAGATDYITKPVNWAVLRNRISYILKAKRAEEALLDEKEKAEVTLASIGDGVITTDALGHIEYMNPVACRLTGWELEHVKGQPLNDVFFILDELSQQQVFLPIEQCLTQGKVVELEGNTVLVRREDNVYFAIEDSAAPIRDRNGQIIGVVLVFHDVTENRKMTLELAYQARHDGLTGLYNLLEFNERLFAILNQEKKTDQIQHHVLVYLDLDRFKIVNDTCGHEAGDQLLRNVAVLLKECLERNKGTMNATLARLGGDEFGLLLENCELEAALVIAHQLRQEIEQFRFFWGKNGDVPSLFTIGVSLGVLPIRSDAVNLQGVLAMADAACYAAKNLGRNQVHVYQDNDHTLFERHQDIQWLALINDSLKRPDGFILFYQEIKPLNMPESGLHIELLLRMQETAGRLCLPGAFLSAAARYGLMPTLDHWVIQHAMRQLSENPNLLNAIKFININISSYLLNDNEICASLFNRLIEFPHIAKKICFELPETTVITDLSRASQFMRRIKELGGAIAIDDFGSGLASFSRLRHLPIDFLKIDGDLIHNMTEDKLNDEMVHSIHRLAQLSGIKTIAESVENDDILTSLAQIKVDYIQGYQVGHPVPLKVLIAKL